MHCTVRKSKARGLSEITQNPPDRSPGTPSRFHSRCSTIGERMCWILLNHNRAHRLLFLNQQLCDHKQQARDNPQGLSVHWGDNNNSRNHHHDSSHLLRLTICREKTLHSSQTPSQVAECVQHLPPPRCRSGNRSSESLSNQLKGTMIAGWGGAGFEASLARQAQTHDFMKPGRWGHQG